jgi:hypothetical protein
MKKSPGGLMKLDELPFGTYREIEANIVEIIINEGVELTHEMIEQAEEALLEKYGSDSYGLLVNRINPYSHTVGSMKKVAKMRNLAALAIVVYSDLSKHAAAIHKLYQKNLRVFKNKEEALAWLRTFLPCPS